MDDIYDFPGFNPQDKKDIKRNLTVSEDSHGVYVYAIAISKNKFCAEHVSIPTVYGEPIGSHCYDMINDRFFIRGVSSHYIGLIPVNYKLKMSDSGWSVDVPLPFTVIKRYMSDEQIKDFKNWKSRHKRHEIKYFQVLNAF
jgi:hypothetical protein